MLKEILDGVAIVELRNPPMNSLDVALRRRLIEMIGRIESMPEVSAIVLVGAGDVFSAGADISEFDTKQAFSEPSIHAVMAAVEASAKPVIAGIAGLAMGGGLELAMAAHYRVAIAGSRIALPEIKLGLIPGAGGTQRLPRAIGLEAAARMICSGDPVRADAPSLAGLFDLVVEQNLLEACLGLAHRIVREGMKASLLRDRAVLAPESPQFLQELEQRAGSKGQWPPAVNACIACLRAAAALPVDAGLAFEREAFMKLFDSPASGALRHAFLAERTAAKIAGLPALAEIRQIRAAAVVGAGTMGAGIAMTFANAGIPVRLLEMKSDALERGLAVIRANYEGSVRRGKLSQADCDKRLALIQPTLSYEELRDADVVVEAVYEDMDAKAGVFKQLDIVCKPGAILASNTSTLDLDNIAATTARPADVVGMHFFVPANVMPLLEVVRARETSPEVLATVMKLAKRLKKTGVVSGVCDGFIGNRMIDPYLRQAYFLLEEGALPEQIDGALEAWGMAMGPFRAGDLTGLDVLWSVRKRRYVEVPDVVYSGLPDRLCELGRFGQKTGAGYYRYEPGAREGRPDDAVRDLIEGYSAEIGRSRRQISDEEIVSRCMLALVNEGAAILDERIAQRASDIDAVYLLGYGFPAFRGGPMYYANTLGLREVIASMERFRERAGSDPAFWQPHRLLLELADTNGTFN